jgi:hypothetical protein
MFVVDWEHSASDEFAAFTMLYTNRWADINAADNDIDSKLRRDPLHHSQPVAEGLRRINSAPLAAYFSIDGNMVHVENIRWIG